MTTVLQITGWSGGTIDLVSSKYAVDTDKWVPSVATRKQSRLAGAIYTDVNENIPIVVNGANPHTVLARAGDLVAAIDQAMRWSKGENVDAVILEYKPDGSAATGNYKAVITGSSNTNIMAQLTASFHNIARAGYALLSLPLTRRGLWSGDTDTAASGSAEAPLVVPGTFTNDDPLGTPASIDTTIFAGGVTVDPLGTEAYIVTTNSASKIDLISAATSLQGGNWSSVVDVKARGGTVLRYQRLGPDPTGAWQESGSAALSIPAAARSIAIFANTKNVNADDVLLRAVVNMGSGVSSGNPVVRTQSITIPGSSDITWRYIGSVSSALEIVGISLEASTVSAVELHVNDVVCVVTDGEDWGVLKINDQQVSQPHATHVYSANHRYVEDITPELSLAYSTNIVPLIHEGTPFFNFTGDTVALAFLSSYPATDYWQLVGGATPVTSSFVATRDRGFLIPI